MHDNKLDNELNDNDFGKFAESMNKAFDKNTFGKAQINKANEEYIKSFSNKNQPFDLILDEKSELYHRKNNDYGDSFKQSLDEFGLLAGVIQMYHKWNRIKTLTKNDKQLVEESLIDSLIDLSNYADMTVMWLRENDNSK